MLNIPEHTWQGKYTFIVHKVRGELLICLTSYCTAMVWHGLSSHSTAQIAEQMKISQADAQAVWDFMLAHTKAAYESAFIRRWSSLQEARKAGDADAVAQCQARVQKVKDKLLALQALADL